MAEKREQVSFELDRSQRAALRRELDVRVSGTGKNWSWNFQERDREGVMFEFKRLSAAIEVMEAIGWVGPSDGPDQVRTSIDQQFAGWAARAAEDLAFTLKDEAPDFTPVDPDADLDALSALRTIGKAA